MMRILLLLSMVVAILCAYSHEDVVRDYQKEKYKEVCLNSAKMYKNNEKDEAILSLIGDACAKVDFINPLGYIVRGLVSNPQYRENGSYFATLVLQKKLIYQFMNDGIDLSNLRLPRSNHILSIVFENLVTKNYELISEKKYKISFEEKEYIIWIDEKELATVFVDVYQNGELLKRHWYI